MITAREAQTNVINYENAIKANVQNKVNELIEIMSKSIAYHSKNGFDTLSFCPYEKSRFSSVKTLEYAQELFQETFENAGYTVIENNYGKNNLTIKW